MESKNLQDNSYIEGTNEWETDWSLLRKTKGLLDHFEDFLCGFLSLMAVRKLDLLQLCFSLKFYFFMFCPQFPSIFPFHNLSSIIQISHLLLTWDTEEKGHQEGSLFSIRKSLKSF